MIWPLTMLSIETWILLFMVVFLIRLYIHHKWQFLEKINIPHDPPSLRNWGTMKTSFASQEIFFLHNKQKEKHGLVHGSYNFLEPVMTVHDLELMRKIYTKEFSNFPDRMKSLRRLNGKEMNDGLTVVTGKQWKRIRSTLTPTFSTAKLRKMVSLMQHCTDQTVAVLQNRCDTLDGAFTAKVVFSNLSLDVIMSTALGADCKVQTVAEDEPQLVVEVKNIFKKGFASPMAMLCFMFPQLEWIFEKLQMSIFSLSSVAHLKKYLMAIIEKREENLQKRNDLLQLLLDAEVPTNDINEDSVEGITRNELVGNALLMIGAGFENTANSMCFLAHNLAFHPEAQARCQKEIDEAFQAKGEFDYETVNSMKYLDMCLNESLRLYCPLIANARIPKKDMDIDGIHFVKNMVVQFPLFGLCHDPEYWEDPWEFKPERMEDMSKIDPMVYQPFGYGPRNCIGLRFALMEIKLTFCKILHKFTLEPLEDTPKPPLELEFAIGIRPKVELGLRAVPRDTGESCC